MSKITFSIIKADVGGYPGHSRVHDELMDVAERKLEGAEILEDYYVTHCGDDLELLMTHREGEDSEKYIPLHGILSKKRRKRRKNWGFTVLAKTCFQTRSQET